MLKKPQPLDMPMICAIMRRCNESMVPASLLESMVKDKVDAAIERSKNDGDFARRRFKENVENFEKASGVKITDKWEMRDISAAVKFIRESGVLRAVETAESLREQCRTIIESIDHAMPKLRASKEGT